MALGLTWRPHLVWLTTLTTLTTFVHAQNPPPPSSGTPAISSTSESPSSTASGPHPFWTNVPDDWEKNKDGSPFIWLIEDDYHGKEFFDEMLFFTHEDPTHGMVTYVPREEAFASKLAYVREDDVVVLKADDTTELPMGEYRKSVRVETVKEYTTGLFILDAETAPWGCGVWPAWWSTSRSIQPWPIGGEIDIVEGVHDNIHNQVAWHTGPNCHLDLANNETYSGTITEKEGPAVDCDFRNHTNYPGCSITEWSRASYGIDFDAQGGGVFAMKWDENGIAVWSFYRSAVPVDITTGKPSPSKWGKPSAFLSPNRCDIPGSFKNHTIIINITFCGDWAGNSYSTTKCPGTCPERLMNPKNFENATWSINSLKVYRKQLLHANIINPNSAHTSRRRVLASESVLGVVMIIFVVLCSLV